MDIIEAVAVLQGRGHDIEVVADDMPLWLVDGGPKLLTDSEMIALASQTGTVEPKI